MSDGRKVFLIDDDRIFNLINEKTISMTNFARCVKAFLLAENALNELRHLSINEPENFPDIIFLDINMPGMDGWDFLDEFILLDENILSRCKVIMLSSSIDPNDIDKSKTYKVVHDFYSKPLTPDKLQALDYFLSEKTSAL